MMKPNRQLRAELEQNLEILADLEAKLWVRVAHYLNIPVLFFNPDGLDHLNHWEQVSVIQNLADMHPPIAPVIQEIIKVRSVRIKVRSVRSQASTAPRVGAPRALKPMSEKRAGQADSAGFYW